MSCSLPTLLGISASALPSPYKKLQSWHPRAIVTDSRDVQKGDLLLLRNTSKAHSQYLTEAAAKGAKLALVDAQAAKETGAGNAQSAVNTMPVFPVDSLMAREAEIAERFYGVWEGAPNKHLIGVTGTNGKTSTVWFILHLLDKMQVSGASIGTLGVMSNKSLGATETALRNTTPDICTTRRYLAEMSDASCIALEVSSIGQEQGRTRGLLFDTIIFTSFARDHLDYHGSLNAYFEAKKSVLATPSIKRVIICIDNPKLKALAKELAALSHLKVLTYGRSDDADYCLTNYCVDGQQTKARLTLPQDSEREIAMTVMTAAPFALENALAATLAVVSSDTSEFVDEGLLEKVLGFTNTLTTPPGRLQKVSFKANNEPYVFVDSAHTEDSLAASLTRVRELLNERGKLWCVFGCGGDRYLGKREGMGIVAARLSDSVLITDDNPRTEVAELIRAQVLRGCKKVRGGSAREVADRHTAIFNAVTEAGADDAILIAGKGHEKYQVVGTEYLPFDDCKVAEEALRMRRGHNV